MENKLEKMFTHLRQRKVSKGQILVYEGDPIESLFYLAKGFVKVFNIHHDGSQRTIIVFCPGEIFPLAGLLAEEGVALYFYECLTEVEIKVLPQKDFEQKIKGDLEIGEELISYSSKMVQQFVERIETLSAQSARQKVLLLLKYLSRKSGVRTDGKVKLTIPLTTQDIADMCSLTRETASVQMIRLKKEGVISGRRNLIIDSMKLKKLAVA